MTYRHVVKICSTLKDIARHIEIELEEISKEVKNEDLMFDLRIIMNELFINAVEHGNKWNDDKCIIYSVDLRPNYIEVIIEDEGEGIGKLESYDSMSLKSSGRGLKIVKELADEFAIYSNVVSFKLFL